MFFLNLLGLDCLQFNLVHMPKWHVLGTPDPTLTGPEHVRPLRLWPQEGDALPRSSDEAAHRPWWLF